MPSIADLLAVLILSYFILYCLWKRKVNRLKQFRGPPPTFLIGVAHQLKTDPSELVQQVSSWMEQYHGEVLLWIGLRPVLITASPKDAQVILSSSEYIKKAKLYRFLHPWLGTGLLTSTGSKWKHRRRLLTPTFHSSILSGFLEVFKENSYTFIKKLEPFTKRGELFDISKYASLCTLDSICETAMGVCCNAQLNSESDYIKAVLSLCGLVQDRQKRPWVWLDFLYKLTRTGRQFNRAVKLVHEFSLKVIKEKIKSKKDKKGLQNQDIVPRKRLAFLDMLIDSVESGDIDIEGLREEVDTFMFEGHDTTASAVSWTLYLLGRHPDIQDRVRDEIDEVTGKFGEENLADIAKELKYLDLVIKHLIEEENSCYVNESSYQIECQMKARREVMNITVGSEETRLLGIACKCFSRNPAQESLRIYPPVPIIAREVHEDLQLGNRILPKGSTAAVGIYGMHMHEWYWPAPKNFDPDRFLPENFAKHDPYSYVPFSAGLRNCVGQKFALLETKIVISTFIQHYQVISLEEEDALEPCGELVLRAKNGIKVKIIERTRRS